jgi:hypothetical protein
MNWALFLQFAGQLAGDIALSQGTNQRAVKYLQLIVAGIGAVKQTDADLTALKAKYAAEVAANKPVTVDELDSLEVEILKRRAAVSAALRRE